MLRPAWRKPQHLSPHAYGPCLASSSADNFIFSILSSPFLGGLAGAYWGENTSFGRFKSGMAFLQVQRTHKQNLNLHRLPHHPLSFIYSALVDPSGHCRILNFTENKVVSVRRVNLKQSVGRGVLGVYLGANGWFFLAFMGISTSLAPYTSFFFPFRTTFSPPDTTPHPPLLV